MSSLTEIANVALIHILERCDFKSLMTLRNVSHSLREFIDESHLKTELTHICITISPSLLRFRWLTKPLPKDVDSIPTRYLTSEEMKTIFSIQNSKLDTLRVSVHRQSQYLDDLEDVLKAKRRPLQTGRLTMGAIDVSEFMKVLPYLDSDALNIVHLSSTGWGKSILDGMEELLETEQMKNAKVFKLDDFMVEKDLYKFFYLQVCDLMFDKLSEEDLVALKEAFITSTHMRSFTLKASNLDGNMLEKIFGSPSSDSVEFNGVAYDDKTWFFEMKNCTEHVLKIRFPSATLYLWKFEKSRVPNDAIIIKV